VLAVAQGSVFLCLALHGFKYLTGTNYFAFQKNYGTQIAKSDNNCDQLVSLAVLRGTFDLFMSQF